MLDFDLFENQGWSEEENYFDSDMEARNSWNEIADFQNKEWDE